MKIRQYARLVNSLVGLTTTFAAALPAHALRSAGAPAPAYPGGHTGAPAPAYPGGHAGAPAPAYPGGQQERQPLHTREVMQEHAC